jgi:hypothetical protein
MQLTHEQNWHQAHSLTIVKSFLVWTFTLTVCLLVVGFPVVVLMFAVGSFLAIVLQSVFPVSAVLLVASGLVGVNLLAIVAGAGILTFKGIHPQDVSWLRWLHGEAKHSHIPVYAACPLTCDLTM